MNKTSDATFAELIWELDRFMGK